MWDLRHCCLCLVSGVLVMPLTLLLTVFLAGGSVSLARHRMCISTLKLAIYWSQFSRSSRDQLSNKWLLLTGHARKCNSISSWSVCSDSGRCSFGAVNIECSDMRARWCNHPLTNYDADRWIILQAWPRRMDTRQLICEGTAGAQTFASNPNKHMLCKMVGHGWLRVPQTHYACLTWMFFLTILEGAQFYVFPIDTRLSPDWWWSHFFELFNSPAIETWTGKH